MDVSELRYVPAEMTAYGVFRLHLMTYDVQWRATYFLSKSAVCADCVILAQPATYGIMLDIEFR